MFNIVSDNKKALNELAKRYPQINIDQYKLARKFYNEIDSIEMQLLETEHSEAQIVVFSNKKGQTYAVPFPGNDYRDYWEFYGEPVINKSNKKTFNIEMKMAFTTLLVDRWKANTIYNDMFTSLLQSRPIWKRDSTMFKNDLHFAYDSCKIRGKNNYQSMFTNIDNYLGLCNTFDDRSHARFFQLKKPKMSVYNKTTDEFIIYRMPCVVKLLYL
jgi:hypothetical protein